MYKRIRHETDAEGSSWWFFYEEDWWEACQCVSKESLLPKSIWNQWVMAKEGMGHMETGIITWKDKMLRSREEKRSNWNRLGKDHAKVLIKQYMGIPFRKVGTLWWISVAPKLPIIVREICVFDNEIVCFLLFQCFKMSSQFLVNQNSSSSSFLTFPGHPLGMYSDTVSEIVPILWTHSCSLLHSLWQQSPKSFVFGGVLHCFFHTAGNLFDATVDCLFRCCNLSVTFFPFCLWWWEIPQVVHGTFSFNFSIL